MSTAPWYKLPGETHPEGNIFAMAEIECRIFVYAFSWVPSRSDGWERGPGRKRGKPPTALKTN